MCKNIMILLNAIEHWNRNSSNSNNHLYAMYIIIYSSSYCCYDCCCNYCYLLVFVVLVRTIIILLIEWNNSNWWNAVVIVITFVVDVILLLVPFFNCRLPLLFSSPILFFCVSLRYMRIENVVVFLIVDIAISKWINKWKEQIQWIE